MNSIFRNIYDNGKYYNPAYLHFGKVIDVHCDRCKRNNIPVSIGWQEYDLCMKCVNDLIKIYSGKDQVYPKPMPTKMMQNIYYGEVVTNMMQDKYRNVTFMRQNKFKDNNCNRNIMTY